MRTIDLSPFRRSSVGFDRMLELLDDNFSFDDTDYPPYNITRTGENTYRISLAVPGYNADQLNIVAHQNVLTVTAKADERDEQTFGALGRRKRPVVRRLEGGMTIRLVHAEGERAADAVAPEKREQLVVGCDESVDVATDVHVGVEQLDAVGNQALELLVVGRDEPECPLECFVHWF